MGAYVNYYSTKKYDEENDDRMRPYKSMEKEEATPAAAAETPEQQPASQKPANPAQNNAWGATAQGIQATAGASGEGKVLSGAATGAMAGAAYSPGNPYAMAVGAGIGALAGMMSSDAELEAKKRQQLMDIYHQQAVGQQNAMTTMSSGWGRLL